MDIGLTIRSFRLNRGMSQGDIERQTGLLRCYLSRVENGHTIPSLETLAKIASAMNIPLAQFFRDGQPLESTRTLPEDQVRFLTRVREYSKYLGEDDRKLIVAMVKKMAAK